MEQGRVREHAIEMGRRKIQSQKILMQDFNPCLAARHLYEGERAVEPDGLMAEVTECDQITPGAASEIKDPVRAGPLQFCEQSLDVL